MSAGQSSSTRTAAGRALGVLAASSLCFASMALCAKLLAPRIPSSQTSLARFAVGLAACVVAATRRPMRVHNRTALLLRGLFGGAAVLLYFAAIAHLPVGVATLLNSTATVFTAFWAALFLGERLSPRTLLAFCLTSTGIYNVVRGGSDTGLDWLSPWHLVGLGSALLSGAAIAEIRIARRTDGTWETFGAFCLIGVLMALPSGLRDWVAPAPSEWLLLTVMAVFSVAAQLLMTYALRFIPAATAGVVNNLTPVSTLVLASVLLHERVTARTGVGAVITLVGITVGAWVRRAPDAQARPIPE